MSTKLYNGITGLLKLICSLSVGLGIGFLALYYSCQYFPFYDETAMIEAFNLVFLILAVSGYIGIIVRSISQIISVFKPINTNDTATLYMEILAVICIIAASESYIFYSVALGSEEAMVFAAIIFVGSIVLTVIDAVVLLIKLIKSKQKIFNGAAFIKVTNGIKLTTIPLLIVGLAVVFTLVIVNNIRRDKLNEALEGGFDSFTMTDIDGNEYTEELFVGHKVTMINVWGTFCHNCIDEMPDLQEISEMYDEKDFQIIGLTGDLYINGEIDQELMDKAIDIVEATGVKYPILIPSKEIQRGVINNIHLYPTTIFFNEKGEQLMMLDAGKTKDAWIKTIEEVLADEEGRN